MNWNEQLSVYWSYKLTLQQIKCSMCVVYYMYVSPHNVFSCIPHILCTKLPCTWAFRPEHLSMEVITWGKGLENLDTCSDMPIHQGECLGKCHIPEGSEHTTDCKHRTWSDWEVKNWQSQWHFLDPQSHPTAAQNPEATPPDVQVHHYKWGVLPGLPPC